MIKKIIKFAVVYVILINCEGDFSLFSSQKFRQRPSLTFLLEKNKIEENICDD